MAFVQRYAVVDVETTFGDPERAPIMEVAVVILEGRGEVTKWSSLVRSGSAPEPFVGMLTGINASMLDGAPTFRDVASQVNRMTEGAVVVAHNARFDMVALGSAFRRLDLGFERQALCTEQLSRRFFPHLRFHNLNSLCGHLGVERRARHRALGDALACADAFTQLVDRFGEEAVLGSTTVHGALLRA